MGTEEESNYLMTCKLKRRCMQIYSKIAEAKALSDSLDRRRDKRLKCVESRYPEINKKIEKFVNRTKHFPDFRDIMKLVKAANKELHLTEGEMHAEAESIFQSVGKTLKKRREIDDHEVMTTYLKEDQNVDPAHGDTELEKRLQEQAELGKKKMSEYMDNFYRENVIQRKEKVARLLRTKQLTLTMLRLVRMRTSQQVFPQVKLKVTLRKVSLAGCQIRKQVAPVGRKFRSVKKRLKMLPAM